MSPFCSIGPRTDDVTQFTEQLCTWHGVVKLWERSRLCQMSYGQDIWWTETLSFGGGGSQSIIAFQHFSKNWAWTDLSFYCVSVTEPTFSICTSFFKSPSPGCPDYQMLWVHTTPNSWLTKQFTACVSPHSSPVHINQKHKMPET